MRTPCHSAPAAGNVPGWRANADAARLCFHAAHPYHVAMRVKISGIKNCDTMKKAFVWLDSHAIAYDFYDYKKLGVTEAALARWCDIPGWEQDLHRAWTPLRKLPEADQQGLTRDKAIALMIANPSMIKRPVLEASERLEIGFGPERYATIFGR